MAEHQKLHFTAKVWAMPFVIFAVHRGSAHVADNLEIHSDAILMGSVVSSATCVPARAGPLLRLENDRPRSNQGLGGSLNVVVVTVGRSSSACGPAQKVCTAPRRNNDRLMSLRYRHLWTESDLGPRLEALVPGLAPWIHAASNPFADWYFGDAEVAGEIIQGWMSRPSSEMFLGRAFLLHDDATRGRPPARCGA